jgi:starch synthase
MPLHRCTRDAEIPLEQLDIVIEVPIGNRRMLGQVWRSHLLGSQVPLYLIEQAEFFDRDDPARGKGLYQYKTHSGTMRDYADNAQRFIFFSRAVLEVLPKVGAPPDVLHCHDWHTGLTPAYLRELYHTEEAYAHIRTLFTIHNLAYQGSFWHWDMALTGLDWKLYNWEQLEFYDRLNFLKGGIVFSDAVNTVSARYAEEIQTPEYGCGMEQVLRHHRAKLSGIMNGVDYGEWNPACDPHVAMPYTASNVVEGKAACKRALQQRLGLPEREDVPLLGLITRLAEQKGLDLVRAIALQLVSEDVQIAVLGLGEPAYHQFLTELQRRAPAKVAVRLEFSERLAHQIEAGADAFLMPSRFEPSGLNQLFSLRYGTIPIVRDTGGLSDSITDVTPQTVAEGAATGFKFVEYSPRALLGTVARALHCYRSEPAIWRQLQQTGMKQDWSWNRSAVRYEELYRQLVHQRV